MKKRFYSIMVSLCFLVLSCFTLTGCDLFHDNNKRYYDEAVALVNGEEITRNEVLTMFNYYYYTNGYYNYGYTEDAVYEMVMEALIKNKLMVIEARKIEALNLTDKDKTEIWEQVFNYIDEQLNTYEDEIRTLYNAPDRVVDEDKEETLYVFKENYERTDPSKIEESDVEVRTYEALKKEFDDSVKESVDYYRYLAYRKYVAELKRSADLYEKNPGTKEECLDREIERLYKYYEESFLVEKYTNYRKTQIVVSDDAILARYNELIKEQMQSFAMGSAYDKAVTNTKMTDLVLYHPEAGSYFTVQQILLKFADYDDEIKASAHLSTQKGYVAQKGDKDGELIKQYLAYRDAYAYKTEGSLDMSYIDDETHKMVSKEDSELTYATLDGIILGLNESGKSNEDIAEEFFKLKYHYSKDGGVTDQTNLLNLMGYALPVDSTKDSGYVSEFNELAYELYNNFDGNCKIGKVVTNYGVHYLMITGVLNKNVLGLEDTFSLVTKQKVKDFLYEQILTEELNNCSNRIGSELYNQYYAKGLIDIKFDKYEDVL